MNGIQEHHLGFGSGRNPLGIEEKMGIQLPGIIALARSQRCLRSLKNQEAAPLLSRRGGSTVGGELAVWLPRRDLSSCKLAPSTVACCPWLQSAYPCP
jgi:hypothetical protein